MSKPKHPDREPLKRLILDHLDAAGRGLTVAEITLGLRRNHPRSPLSIHECSVRLALYELVDSEEVKAIRPGVRTGFKARAWTYATVAVAVESEVGR